VRKVLKIFLIAAGAVLILDTLFILTVSNINLGVIMPALLGVPLLVFGLVYEQAAIWFRSGFGEAVKWLMISGYSLFLLTFAVTLFLVLVKSRRKTFDGADAVIVLGAGLRGSRVSWTLAKRLDTAVEYAEKNQKALLIVTGARGHGEKMTEACAMERYLTEKGIGKDRIIKEENAVDTVGNFRYSKQILDGLFKREYRAVYVTTDFHLFRAGLAAEKQGLKAHGIGSSTKWYLLPNSYLREYIAIWQYVITGKISLVRKA
jgi:uncharacterized SAM-binding protein YcdF (DUF218 family)